MFGIGKKRKLTDEEMKDNPLSVEAAAQKIRDAKKRDKEQRDRIAKEAGWTK